MSQAIAALSTWLLLSFITLKQCEANALFHFSLDLNVKERTNDTELINKTIKLENNQLTSSNTNEELQMLTEDSHYNWDAVKHLIETKRAVQLLNVELSPLVGRSNNLAAVLKKSMRYVNDVDPCLENGHFAQHLEQLRKYTTLVKHLKSGSVRTLEFVLLKLAMEKFQMLAKYEEVSEYLRRADEAWNRYKNTQTVLTEKS